MTFNEFQRELRKKGVEPKMAYFLTMLFERQVQLGQDIEMNAKVLLDMAQSMEGFVNLSKEQQLAIRNLQRMGLADGVDVRSVAWDKKLEED